MKAVFDEDRQKASVGRKLVFAGVLPYTIDKNGTTHYLLGYESGSNKYNRDCGIYYKALLGNFENINV